MSESPPDTRDRILQAAEEVLRRFGPAKTTVVDVARHLGMSHGNVYRHFPSKAALREAVAERWLATVSRPLARIAASGEPAERRLETWLLALAEAKRRKIHDDPELFATYHVLAADAATAISTHVDELRGQLARIVADGIADGSFNVADPAAAAVAVLTATLDFHHPVHVRAAGGRNREAEARPVIRLVLAGLKAGVI